MGKSQRDKGARIEREMVRLLNEIPGVEAERVPLSGAAGGSYSGDISMRIAQLDVDGVVEIGMTAEAKGRANGDGFVTLEKWLGKNDMLILKRDRQEPMVVLPWVSWEKIVGG